MGTVFEMLPRRKLQRRERRLKLLRAGQVWKTATSHKVCMGWRGLLYRKKKKKRVQCALNLTTGLQNSWLKQTDGKYSDFYFSGMNCLLKTTKTYTTVFIFQPFALIRRGEQMRCPCLWTCQKLEPNFNNRTKT